MSAAFACERCIMGFEVTNGTTESMAETLLRSIIMTG